MYLLPAMVAARSMEASVMPIQFDETSKSGRRPLAFSS